MKVSTVPVVDVLFGFCWALYFFMQIKMITWNVRGLNDPKKGEILKNWLREWKVDVVCLQETKLEKVDWSMICSLWGIGMLVGKFLMLFTLQEVFFYYGINGC